MENIRVYLSGKKLYGDDFSLEDMERWFSDEREGYADLGSKYRKTYEYVYHALNEFHGFNYIGRQPINNALGFGSAYGEEFLPIIKRIKNLTIVDPSENFVAKDVHGVPCRYVKPSIDGIMPFENKSFDVILCLGVLHHIPNVTTVVNELFRCLAPGGKLLLREPIISMGDWTEPRSGLTKRERGIPLDIFCKIISTAGFIFVHQSLCVFPLIAKIFNRIGVPPYNDRLAVRLDAILSKMFAWNTRYHATRSIHKFRPTSLYLVLRK